MKFAWEKQYVFRPLRGRHNETVLNSFYKSDLWKYNNHRGADDFSEDILLNLEKDAILDDTLK